MEAISAVETTYVQVADFATGGAGTLEDPWTGWDTAITWTAKTEYRFRAGVYAHDGDVNFAKPEIAIVGEGSVFIKHTGRGYGMKFDASTDVFLFGYEVRNINVIGNYFTGTGTASPVAGQTSLTGSGTNWQSTVEVGDSITFYTDDFLDVETRIVTAVNSDTSLTLDSAWTTSRTNAGFRVGTTTHGFWISGSRSLSMSNCGAKHVSDAAFFIEAGVCNYYENIRHYYYTPDGAGIAVRPKYGLQLATRGDGAGSTASVFSNVVMESTRTAGIITSSGSGNNLFLAGTSEGNIGKGIICDGIQNVFDCMILEVNDDVDIEVLNGSQHKFRNCVCPAMTITQGSRMTIEGCSVVNLTISSQASNTFLINNAVSSLTDGSQTTRTIGNTTKALIGISTSGDLVDPYLDVRANDGESATTGLQTNNATAVVFNENTSADSYAQLLLINRASGAGYYRLVAVSRGSTDSDIQEITNAGIISELDGSASKRTFYVDIVQRPSASIAPSANGDVVIEKTSNTQLTFKLKGSDGVVRSGVITLS